MVTPPTSDTTATRIPSINPVGGKVLEFVIRVVRSWAMSNDVGESEVGCKVVGS